MAGVLRHAGRPENGTVTVSVIAVDGPGGSGKTSVSRAVAMRLGLPHLDTGAYYRAATVAVLRAGVDLSDIHAVARCVAKTQLEYDHGRMTMNGQDVTLEIRSDEVTGAVSEVSAIPVVREQMVSLQRTWVREHGDQAVVEGRDIGTVVFPDAPLKVYLTAHPEVRAERRALEHPTSNDPSEIETDLRRRDTFDSSRSVSPLQQADDAVVIDTTDLSMDEVIDRAAELARAALNKA